MKTLERISNRIAQAFEEDSDEKVDRFERRCDALLGFMIKAMGWFLFFLIIEVYLLQLAL
jgi:hypothetical protein